MIIRARKSLRFGPFRINLTQRGLTSWGVKLGPWSWNSRTRAHRLDLPGPLYWQGKGKRRSARQRPNADGTK